MAVDSDQQIAAGVSALSEALDQLLESEEYEALELPKDFAKKVFDIAWEHRSGPSDEGRPKLNKDLRDLIRDTFPNEIKDEK